MLEQIRTEIIDKRPLLSTGSITTYAYAIRKVYQSITNIKEFNLELLNNTEKVFEYLKDITPNKRKTILSALFVITNNPQYRTAMMTDIQTYTQEIELQEKNETQRDNWIEQDELDTIFKDMKKTAKELYKKETLDKNDFQKIQQYIMLSLYGGRYIAPRRAVDFTKAFKIQDIDPAVNNFIDYDKKEFVFNTYKTAKTYGEQRVAIPKKLFKILVKWISINPTPYLFFDTKNNGLSSITLSQRLNNIFGGRKISVNQLRHFYLTNKHLNTVGAMDELNNDMTNMGSSISMAKTYIKKN
jgi:phage-related protein